MGRFRVQFSAMHPVSATTQSAAEIWQTMLPELHWYARERRSETQSAAVVEGHVQRRADDESRRRRQRSLDERPRRTCTDRWARLGVAHQEKHEQLRRRIPRAPCKGSRTHPCASLRHVQRLKFCHPHFPIRKSTRIRRRSWIPICGVLNCHDHKHPYSQFALHTLVVALPAPDQAFRLRYPRSPAPSSQWQLPERAVPCGDRHGFAATACAATHIAEIRWEKMENEIKSMMRRPRAALMARIEGRVRPARSEREYMHAETK